MRDHNLRNTCRQYLSKRLRELALRQQSKEGTLGPPREARHWLRRLRLMWAENEELRARRRKLQESMEDGADIQSEVKLAGGREFQIWVKFAAHEASPPKKRKSGMRASYEVILRTEGISHTKRDRRNKRPGWQRVWRMALSGLRLLQLLDGLRRLWDSHPLDSLWQLLSHLKESLPDISLDILMILPRIVAWLFRTFLA